MTTNVLSGEQSNTKIVAVFKTKNAAEECAQKIQEKGLDPNQFDIVAPNEEDYSDKLEPEDQGVKRTAIKSHVVFGVLGLIFGAVLWGVLYYLDVTLLKSAPIVSIIAFLFVAASGGLMLGGFITMRVDHQVVIQEVDTAIHEGHWALIMHSRNTHQTHLITQTLSDLGIDSARSL